MSAHESVMTGGDRVQTSNTGNEGDDRDLKMKQNASHVVQRGKIKWIQE